MTTRPWLIDPRGVCARHLEPATTKHQPHAATPSSYPYYITVSSGGLWEPSPATAPYEEAWELPL